jgi:hypothetical protein
LTWGAEQLHSAVIERADMILFIGGRDLII